MMNKRKIAKHRPVAQEPTTAANNEEGTKVIRVQLQGIFCVPASAKIISRYTKYYSDDCEHPNRLFIGPKRFIPIICFREINRRGNLGEIIVADDGDLISWNFYEEQFLYGAVLEWAKVDADGAVLYPDGDKSNVFITDACGESAPTSSPSSYR